MSSEETNFVENNNLTDETIDSNVAHKKEAKTEEIIEINIDSKQENNIIEENHINENSKYKTTSKTLYRTPEDALIIFRPQRNQSPRKIKIVAFEERKVNFVKYHVYIIECDPPHTGVINVARRYNEFKWLRTRLAIEYPGMFVPPLPPTKIMGRFEDEFVEERRYDLERFLQRIEEVKPFNESPSFRLFLTRPETTLAEGKKAIEENTKTISQQTSDLQLIFPDLTTEELSNEAVVQDVPRLKEFLTKIEYEMKMLLMAGEKLFEHLTELCNDMSAFTEAFEKLVSAERNYPYKPKIERQDIKKPLEEWNQFESRQTEIYYEYFYRSLRHEYEDVVAFLELFKFRDTIEAKWNKAKAKVEKWGNEQKNDVALKEKDELTKKKDIEEERDLSAFLSIMTKVMLQNEISIVWKEKTETWRRQILHFAELYSDVTQKLALSWKNVKA